MKYNTVHPFFFKKDINFIFREFRKILNGSGLLSMGKFVRLFENNFSTFNKSKYVIATSSGTSALEIILKSLNIKAGDEIIVPCQTFIGTVSPIINIGAKPIFAEIDKDFLLDEMLINKLITKKTKAVILVHYCGLIHINIFKIKKFLNKRNIYLIEDASHAHGASLNNIKAGNLSDVALFSLYSSKIITSGEGGTIKTNNKSIYKKCLSIRSRGLDIDKKDEIYSNLGSNFRVSEIHALLALTQLKNINFFINHRIKIAKIYTSVLHDAVNEKKIRIIITPKNIINPYWKYTIFLLKKQNRNKIKSIMNKKSIGLDWAYEPLVHMQPVIQKNYKVKKLPFSEELSKTHINLPTHYGINLNQAKDIVTALLKTL